MQSVSADFLTAQSSVVPDYSFEIWVSGVENPEDYLLYVETNRMIPEFASQEVFAGTAMVVLSNEDETFFDASGRLVDRDAEIKIYAGYGDENVQIFSGIVVDVYPALDTNTVTLYCHDNMGRLLEHHIKGNQGSNNTPKLILEYIASLAGLPASVDSWGETTATYDRPTFWRQSLYTAAQSISDTIFCVCYFDEAGDLQLKERERGSIVDWTFDDDNAIGVSVISDTQIINKIYLEHRYGFFSLYKDQASIDQYREHARSITLPFINDELISSLYNGFVDEELDETEHAFKITADESGYISSIWLAMAQDGGSGDVIPKIYSDDSGPGTLLRTGVTVDAGDFYKYESYEWALFEFDDPYYIDANESVWIALNVSGVTGTVYMRRSGATATELYSEYDGSDWTNEDDKEPVHIVRGSIEAQRVCEDAIAFLKDPHQRVQVQTVGCPQLQLMDEVMLDISNPFALLGSYVVEQIGHVMSPYEFSSTFILRESTG